MIFFSQWTDVDFNEIVALYESIGWEHYVKNPEKLKRAFENADYAVVATDSDENHKVVGLARIVSDREYVCLIQDIIVHPHQQRKGIGRKLMNKIQERHKNIRTFILLTDDEERQRLFYESLNYKNTKEFDNGCLNAFVKIENNF